MKVSGDPMPFAIRSTDLRGLTESAGPVASVYLTTAGDIENAGRLCERRWKTLRNTLADQGAPAEALEAIDPLVATAYLHGECLAAFATGDALVHVEYGPEAPPFDFGSWEGAPVLGPLIGWRQSSLPFVMVLTDRRGADIVAFGPTDAESRSVAPEDGQPQRKVAAGGWSQARYQRRAENTWDSHARQVADAVGEVSDQLGAQAIVVAGDVRAVELLEEHLPDRLVHYVREIEGGRAAGVSADQMEEATRRWVAERSARCTVAALEKFREELGQHDRAADGLEATLAALNESRVEVLLVRHDWMDTRRAWFGPAAIPIAAAEQTLRDLGIRELSSARLIDVAIRAALGTSAGVWTIPRAGGPRDGIGAILRWS